LHCPSPRGACATLEHGRHDVAFLGRVLREKAPMEIRDDEIRQLETLAALKLDPQERLKLRTQLGRILDYVRQLEALDLDDVTPTTHVLPSNQPLRTDETRPSLSREEMLRNAADQRDGFYRVPRFVGEEDNG